MRKIVVNNRWKWILGGVVVECLSIWLLVDELFFDSEMLEIPSRAPVLFAIVFSPWIIYWEIKDMGSFEITDEYVYAKYPNRLQRGFIDLQEPVYYTFYTKQGDFGKFILLSNEIITDDQQIMLYGIDYATQISIHYTKKVRKVLPKDNWIEVHLENHHTI